MIVSLYNNATNVTAPKYFEIDKILDSIKSDALKNKILQLRLHKYDKVLKSTIKQSLPSICFSGKFNKRCKEGIIKHSGFAIMDFDHIENILEFKAKMCKDEYTYAAFISPSGDGLKVLVKIPAEIENHEAYYLGLIDKYPSLDAVCRDISRVCFASWDPELYLNKDSKIFNTKGLKKTVDNEVFPPLPSTINTDFKKMQIVLELIRNSKDGEKHQNLIRASRLAGGFVAGGLAEETEAVRLLEKEINKKDIVDFKGACKTIQDGIEFGKKEPVIEDNFKDRLKQIIKEDIIIEDAPARDVIFLEDVREKIVFSYLNGTSRGETTHFPEIDEKYRMKRGEITLVHGIGNHGKSAFLYQICLIKSILDGYKWGIFSPESMPEEEFYKDLIHTYIGKSTERHHPNQMTMGELEKAMKFVGDHFFLIYPENNSPTPWYMNNRFRELIIKEQIDGCITDPYNQLDNDIASSGGREDQYLSNYLSNSKRFALEHNLFYYIIAHPKGGLKKDKDGNYECPDVYDLSGGAMWNNKMDNILAIHRPVYNTNKNSTSVLFKSQKIKKQKLNGIPGDVYLDYNRMEGRFKQQSNMFTPLAPHEVILPSKRYEVDRNEDITFNEKFDKNSKPF